MAISFLTKINSNNTYGGTKIFGGSRYIVSYEIEIASSGNIYISGNFGNTVDFGADFGVSDVKTGTGINQSGTFIVKLNANGTYGWAKMISGTSIVNSYSISVDSSECIIVSGIFRGTIDFGSDFGVTDIKTSTGATNDTFITKFNSNRYLWTKTIGGTTEAYGGEVAVSDDKIFVTGYFSGSIDFGHDFGVNDIKTAIGYEELYITRIEANGNYCWTKVFSNADKKRLYNAVINNSRYVYIVGIFNGTLDFGKDFGTTDIKTSKGSGNWEIGDVFITKITVNGSYEWTKRIGGTGDDLAFSIDLDSKSNVYTYGFYDSTVDFGEDFGATDIKNLSTTYNLFLTKLLQ